MRQRSQKYLKSTSIFYLGKRVNLWVTSDCLEGHCSQEYSIFSAWKKKSKASWMEGRTLESLQHNDIDGLVQERRNSSAFAMELRLSCTNPSISSLEQNVNPLRAKFFRESINIYSQVPL